MKGLCKSLGGASSANQTVEKELSYSDSSNVTKSYSKYFDFEDNIIIRRITGTIILGHSGASASSTQTITIKVGDTTVYTFSKSRGSKGSCTYDIDIKLDDSNAYSGLTVSYSSTDNEKEKNYSLIVYGMSTNSKTDDGINIPEGDWALKSTSLGDTFPGFSNNVIPIVVQATASGSWAEPNDKNTRSASASINGVQVAYGYGKLNCTGTTGRGITVNNYYVFAPACFGMDLVKTQKGLTSGTVKIWLEKK